MIVIQAKREEASNPMHSFFSSVILKLSPKPNLPKKPNLLHVPGALAPLSTGADDSKHGDELTRVFRCFDKDGDGRISPAELRDWVRTVGEELSSEDAEAMVEFLDLDGDGLLGFEDLTRLVEAEGEEEKGRNMREAFEVYGDVGVDCITPRSLSGALARLGQARSVEECEAMIRRFDINGDGVISFDEFRAMML